MTDDLCERCANSLMAHGEMLCCPPGAAFSRPVDFMRHPKSQCGPDGSLFDPRGIEDYELEYD